MGEFDPFDRSDLKNQPERDHLQPAKGEERHGPDDNEKVGHGREPKKGANGGLSHGSQPKL